MASAPTVQFAASDIFTKEVGFCWAAKGVDQAVSIGVLDMGDAGDIGDPLARSAGGGYHMLGCALITGAIWESIDEYARPELP